VISIKDTIGSLWVPCPKCKSAVCITEWGEQTCIYEGCDGNKFLFELNFDTSKLILEEIKESKIRNDNSQKFPLIRPSMPKLQGGYDCWFVVQQPDSTNPDDWYANDPFKK